MMRDSLLRGGPHQGEAFVNTLIVGGDYVDGLVGELAGLGLRRIEHWGGRKVRDLNRSIPADMDLVVVLFDYSQPQPSAQGEGCCGTAGSPGHLQQTFGRRTAAEDRWVEEGGVSVRFAASRSGGSPDGHTGVLPTAVVRLATTGGRSTRRKLEESCLISLGNKEILYP